MRKLILNLIFRFYFKDMYNEPLNELQRDRLLTKLSNTVGLELFPLFLEQCTTNARNKYLYTNDPVFKGSIMAYTYLRDELKKRRVNNVSRELTQDEKVGIMKGRGY